MGPRGVVGPGVQSTGRYRVEGIKSELGATNRARCRDRFKLSWVTPFRCKSTGRAASSAGQARLPDVGSNIGHGIRRHVGRRAQERAEEAHGRRLKGGAQADMPNAPVR